MKILNLASLYYIDFPVNISSVIVISVPKLNLGAQLLCCLDS
jgi:hypothetical protein